MADWSTIASMSTAVGTLVLAFATFSATRGSNRSARIAERALAAGLRPLLVTSRRDDPVEKIMWSDRRWTSVRGGGASVEIDDDRLFLAMALRNVGNGMAVIHGWRAYPTTLLSDVDPTPADAFRRQIRDLYIAPSDTGFWQGAYREQDDPERGPLVEELEHGGAITVELLYGDEEGGQRTITRFALVPHPGDSSDSLANEWLVTVSRHWNLDRDDPR
jgi:hypothetical protein